MLIFRSGEDYISVSVVSSRESACDLTCHDQDGVCEPDLGKSTLLEACQCLSAWELESRLGRTYVSLQ